jgi:hypothetical protein
MTDLINIDRKFPECTAIDTDVWLERVLGKPIAFECDGRWLSEQNSRILEFIESAEPGTDYRATDIGNVYNDENDFSSVFQWQVFYPADAGDDWLYADDVYVAVEQHLGGDVRGNYGAVRLYRADSLADSGFLDWCLGWNVNYASGDEVPENDHFSVSYAPHPFSEVQRHLKGGWSAKIHWSDKRQCFVSTYHDGRFVELRPNLYV